MQIWKAMIYRIESQNINDAKFWNSELNQCFGKQATIPPIFIPCPHLPFFRKHPLHLNIGYKYWKEIGNQNFPTSIVCFAHIAFLSPWFWTVSTNTCMTVFGGLFPYFRSFIRRAIFAAWSGSVTQYFPIEDIVCWRSFLFSEKDLVESEQVGSGCWRFVVLAHGVKKLET